LLAEKVGDNACLLARRWTLDVTLAEMLVALDAWGRQQFAGEGIRWPGVTIFSGHRTPARQAEVNPANPNSLHTRCPSMAADVTVGSFAGLSAPAIQDWLGARWLTMGGRYGGAFTNPATGKPDREHFDLGVGTSSVSLPAALELTDDDPGQCGSGHIRVLKSQSGPGGTWLNAGDCYQCGSGMRVMLNRCVPFILSGPTGGRFPIR